MKSKECRRIRAPTGVIPHRPPMPIRSTQRARRIHFPSIIHRRPIPPLASERLLSLLPCRYAGQKNASTDRRTTLPPVVRNERYDAGCDTRNRRADGPHKDLQFYPLHLTDDERPHGATAARSRASARDRQNDRHSRRKGAMGISMRTLAAERLRDHSR